MAESSSRGLSLGLVVVCLISLGGILYYSINQVNSEIPASVGGVARPGSASAAAAGGVMSLSDAIEKGNSAAISAAIKAGAKVDELIADGSKAGLSPLMCAALASKPECVTALIKGGAKVSLRSKDGKTALIYAAGWANPVTVNAVLEGKPNIDERTEDRLTSLMMAAARGEAANVKVLIDAGADVNAKNKWGENSLMLACKAGDAEKVQLLLAAGSNVNDSDIYGMTAIGHAASSTGPGAVDITKALLAKRVEVNAPDSEGMTPLMHAADVGDSERITLLLAGGANKAMKDRGGRNAYEWAKSRSDDASKAICELLK